MSTSVSINGTGYSIPGMGEAGWLTTFNAYLAALVTAKSGALVWGVSSGVTTAARYAPPGYGAASTNEIQFSAPATGTLRNLYVKCRTAPAGDSVVVTVRKTGAATAMTCTVAAAATTAADTTNTVSVTAGDALSLSVTGGASFSSGAADLIASVSLTPA